MTGVATNRNNGDDERIKKHYELMNIELLLRIKSDRRNHYAQEK